MTLSEELLSKTTPDHNDKDGKLTRIYHEFCLLCKKDRDYLICIFEGKDDLYYCSRISNTIKMNYKQIRCGGKKNVLELFNFLNEQKEYKDEIVAYFIDRDFDESLKNLYPNLYETPCYSIENLYCNESLMRKVSENHSALGPNDNRIDDIIKIFTYLLDDFLDKMLTFNAWYKCYKSMFKSKIIKTKVCLNELKIKDFVEIKLDGITPKYDLSKLNKLFNLDHEITQTDIKNYYDELSNSDRRNSLRGKFIFEFLFDFCVLIEKEKSIKYLIKKDKNNSLLTLSNYAHTPNCLTEFLERFN